MLLQSRLLLSKPVLVIALTLVMAIQAAAIVPIVVAGDEPLPLCHGLLCNDAGDCGSKCFCNNPFDTLGQCIADR